MFLNRDDNLVLFRYLGNTMIINWRITLNCNFNCLYCGTHNNKKDFPSLKNLKDIVDFINELNREDIEINITGGEATTHPDFFNLLEYIAEVFSKSKTHYTIRLFSNLSKPVSFYDKFFKILQDSKIRSDIFASFHKEFINLISFIEKYEYLNIKYKIVPFAFMLHSNKCAQSFNELVQNKNPYIRFSPAAIFSKQDILRKIKIEDDPLYTHSLSIYFKDGEYSYRESDFELSDLRFKGFFCRSFKGNMFIDIGGDIYYCILCKTHTKPLNIYQKNIQEIIRQKEYSLCPVPVCQCDTGVPKINFKHLQQLKDIDIEYVRKNMRKI